MVEVGGETVVGAPLVEAVVDCCWAGLVAGTSRREWSLTLCD
jgi:hypothetical protein